MRPKEREDIFTFYLPPNNKEVTYENVNTWYFLVYDMRLLNKRINNHGQVTQDYTRYKPAVFANKNWAINQAKEARDKGYSVDVIEVPSSEIIYAGKKIIE